MHYDKKILVALSKDSKAIKEGVMFYKTNEKGELLVGFQKR